MQEIENVPLQVVDTFLYALDYALAEHYPGQVLCENRRPVAVAIDEQIDGRCFDKFLVDHPQQAVKSLSGRRYRLSGIPLSLLVSVITVLEAEMSKVEFKPEQTLGLEVLVNFEYALLSRSLLCVNGQD